MKNLKYLFIIILMLVMAPAANALTADELFEKESARYTEHLEQINEIAKEKGLPEVTLENAGPVYSYDGHFEDGSFTEELTLRNFLFYIVKNGYLGFGLNPETGEWQGGTGASTAGGFGSAVDTEEAGYGYPYPDKDGNDVYVDLSLYGMCKTAAELTDNRAVTVRYCGIDSNNRYVYVMTDDGEEYMIQYTRRPDLTGRENFILYPFDEIFGEQKANYEKQFAQREQNDEVVETGEGGSSYSEQLTAGDSRTDEKKDKTIMLIVGIFAVVVIGATVILTVTKKRSKQ